MRVELKLIPVAILLGVVLLRMLQALWQAATTHEIAFPRSESATLAAEPVTFWLYVALHLCGIAFLVIMSWSCRGSLFPDIDDGNTPER